MHWIEDDLPDYVAIMSRFAVKQSVHVVGRLFWSVIFEVQLSVHIWTLFLISRTHCTRQAITNLSPLSICVNLALVVVACLFMAETVPGLPATEPKLEKAVEMGQGRRAIIR